MKRSLKGVDDCIASPSQQKKQKTVAQTEPLRLNLSDNNRKKGSSGAKPLAEPLTGLCATANRPVVVLLRLF